VPADNPVMLIEKAPVPNEPVSLFLVSAVVGSPAEEYSFQQIPRFSQFHHPLISGTIIDIDYLEKNILVMIVIFIKLL
jgi:hypothetical protein